MSEENVWLIRHGQSTTNIGIWGRNPHQAELTSKGTEQALHIAKQIMTKPDLIITSPCKRALETAAPIIKRWDDIPVEVWPIQEIVYLSPEKCDHITLLQRQERVASYWRKADPLFCDGEDAESFANFIRRLQEFYKNLLTKNGFRVVIGHGQFFKAFILGLSHGFAATSEWMRWFRQQETTNPIANCEIIKLKI